jgi:GNAT superfamily N-acetyltransferase
VLLYLSKRRRVLGCVAIDIITTAYRYRSNQCGPGNEGNDTSMVAVPVRCGVYRLWVDREHRRKQIATKLLDVLRYVIECTNTFEDWLLLS